MRVVEMLFAGNTNGPFQRGDNQGALAFIPDGPASRGRTTIDVIHFSLSAKLAAAVQVSASLATPRASVCRVSAADYRIGGDGLARHGFDAVVGVNMDNTAAVNPLAHIGAHSAMGRLWRYGVRA